MISLTTPQLLSFFRAWRWIVSDRVGEFDDVLHRPIASVGKAKVLTHELIAKWETIEPDDSVSRVIDYFEGMLSALEVQGFDISLIYDWSRSISLFMQDSNARRAMIIWSETFERFALGKRGPAEYIDEYVLERLSESFLRDAFKPGLEFATRVRSSERQWVSNPERRTEFDNALWAHFFSEYDVDPGSIVSLGYRQVLVREWWRTARASLSEEQTSELRLEQIDNTKNFSKSRVPAWKLDDSIHEAMVFEGFPVFDTQKL